MAAILWDDTDTGRLFGISTVRKMLRKFKSPSEATRRVVGKTLSVNLIYAVSTRESVPPYEGARYGFDSCTACQNKSVFDKRN